MQLGLSTMKAKVTNFGYATSISKSGHTATQSDKHGNVESSMHAISRLLRFHWFSDTSFVYTLKALNATYLTSFRLILYKQTECLMRRNDEEN